MFLIISGDYVVEKADLKREDLIRAKQYGDLVIDIHRRKQFNPDENQWVNFAGAIQCSNS